MLIPIRVCAWKKEPPRAAAAPFHCDHQTGMVLFSVFSMVESILSFCA